MFKFRDLLKLVSSHWKKTEKQSTETSQSGNTLPRHSREQHWTLNVGPLQARSHLFDGCGQFHAYLHAIQAESRYLAVSDLEDLDSIQKYTESAEHGIQTWRVQNKACSMYSLPLSNQG